MIILKTSPSRIAELVMEESLSTTSKIHDILSVIYGKDLPREERVCILLQVFGNWKVERSKTAPSPQLENYGDHQCSKWMMNLYCSELDDDAPLDDNVEKITDMMDGINPVDRALILHHFLKHHLPGWGRGK